MTEQHYDLVVIGAGPAGGAAATAAAAPGRRVALIERDKLGGTCLNYGCDPTKTLLHTAQLLYQASQSAERGLRIPHAAADWPAVQAHVRRVLKQMRGGSEAAERRQRRRDGVEVLSGAARFVDPHTLRLGRHRLRADRIIIATGSQAVVPPIDGLERAGYLTNREAVALKELPRRLAIIGGGPIGVEFAQLFGRFGVKVTLLEQGPALLPKDDRELADQLAALLAAEGVHVETEAELLEVHRERAGRCLIFRRRGRTRQELQVDAVLVAVGFRPAIDSLNLPAAGVSVSDGAVRVDATLRTSVPHIWAAGDVTGGYPFTHVAFAQGQLVARNAFASRAEPFDDQAIPWVTYTSPELAHIGQTEEQLRQAGTPYRVGRKPLAEVERAVATGATAGQIKLLVGDDGRLLGGHILAAGAGELIAPLALAMRAGLPVDMLANTILPYPTMAEGLRWAAEAVPERERERAVA
jgi:pyruvate/2-oxoglutarate dehydrogenase complex dihydrolipoamide dehydrogenase (E3) component